METRRNLSRLAAILAPCAAAHAQPITGVYVSLGGGVNFACDQNVEPSGFGPVGHSYTVDPGGAAEASVGFGFGNGLRVEAEGDSGSLRAGEYEPQYDGFGDDLYDLPFALPVHPYIGLGAGHQEVELDHVNVTEFGAPVGPAAAPITRGNFAYQAIAGLAYPLPLPGLSLTAECRSTGVLFGRGLCLAPRPLALERLSLRLDQGPLRRSAGLT